MHSYKTFAFIHPVLELTKIQPGGMYLIESAGGRTYGKTIVEYVMKPLAVKMKRTVTVSLLFSC